MTNEQEDSIAPRGGHGFSDSVRAGRPRTFRCRLPAPRSAGSGFLIRPDEIARRSGPTAIAALRAALDERGLSFRI